MNAQECVIPVAVLKAEPFSLPWGTNVHARLYATNSEGDSEMSDVGNGAIITTYPDKPINFIEYYPTRDVVNRVGTLGMTWEEAAFNGGAAIIDYRVSIAVQGQAFEYLATGLLTPEYTAINLTPGVTYEFKVQSRNSYDYSDYSEVLTMLMAFVPEEPDAPVTYRVTN